MIKFMAGNLWTHEYLDLVEELNKLNPEVRITELYGSHKSTINPIGSARPDYRLPDTDEELIAEIIDRANNMGILTNYTLNTPCIGHVDDFNGDKMKPFIEKLEDWGVGRITVAHPMVMELIDGFSDIPLEISTIQHVNSTSQLEFYSRFNVDKVCLDIYKNRDLDLISQLIIAGRKYRITIELMVNEFCVVHGAPCEGIYRRACYNAHAHGGDPEDKENVPMLRRCIMGEDHSVADWLKARFILPADVRKYQAITGCDHYKISGRTLPLKDMDRILRMYLTETTEGSLTDLWKVKHTNPLPFIPLNRLKKFFMRWAKKTDFHCSEHCGVDCFYCDDVAKHIGKQ